MNQRTVYRILVVQIFVIIFGGLPRNYAQLLGGAGLSESLSSVLDCKVNGKAGLCVPTALKDVVCIPLGFQSAPDVKTCGSDNVCCHSTVEKANGTSSSAVTTTVKPIGSFDPANTGQKGSASILLLTAAKPEQATASESGGSSATDLQITVNNTSPDKISRLPVKASSNSDRGSIIKPRPIKIPASLTAYIPGFEHDNDDDDSDTTTVRPSKATQKPSGTTTPIKFCRVGSSQGMCVKKDLIQSLCLPLGFATSPQGCSGGFMCCFTLNSDDNDVTKGASSAGQKSPINKPGAPIPTIRLPQKKAPQKKEKPLDVPTSMDTCNPQTGVAGLCIRSDIAQMVCTPLGYAIGDRLTCAADRICCFLNKTDASPTNQLLTLPSPPQTSFLGPNLPARPCQLGAGISGVCVPANLISSCPLFGKKVSAFGCATRHLALPNYCCYEEVKNQNADVSDGSRGRPGDLEPMQPFISVAGTDTVPKLDSVVCGRKGLTGIEPRALARHSRILGSHPTLPGEFCWHAALFDPEGNPFCNGALVNREWVLTAAHCVKRVPPSKMAVKLGMWALNGTSGTGDMSPPTQIFRVREAFLHYSYDAVTLDNDVALLHLDNQVDLSEPQVCLICLPSQDNYDGAQCTISSFSPSEGNTLGNTSVLSQLDFTVINASSCQSQLVATGKLQNNFRLNGDVTLCAKSNAAGEDTCRGDGGSSIACQNADGIYEVSGLVSWGLTCGTGSPTVFTRVWLYNSWIQEIIRRYT